MVSDLLPAQRSIALVTGAAQGIGRGIARSLAQAAYRVMLADIDDDLLALGTAELQAAGFDVVSHHLDVASGHDWASAIAVVSSKWGGLDVLVNCAGISPRGTVESTSEALWDQTLGINLKGPWLGVKNAIPSLRQRRGTIINIGSTRATRPMPGLFSYIVSKAGLWGLTQQVAVEYLNESITCNMIAPGWVDTPNERLIQAKIWPSRLPRGDPQPDDARGNRGRGRLPCVAPGPKDQRCDPLSGRRATDRRRRRHGLSARPRAAALRAEN